MKKIMENLKKTLLTFLVTFFAFKPSYAESPIIINKEAFEGIDDKLISIFKLVFFFLLGAFIGYHIGVLIRTYIKLVFWGLVLYIVSLIVLQSLGVITLETETLIKVFLILIPFIKTLIELNLVPKSMWWGIFIGFFLGLFDLDVKVEVPQVKGKEGKK